MLLPEFTKTEALLRAYDLYVNEPLLRLQRRTKNRVAASALRTFRASIYPNSPRYLIFRPIWLAYCKAPFDTRQYRDRMTRLMVWADPSRPRWVAMCRKVTQREINRIADDQRARMFAMGGYRPKTVDQVLAEFYEKAEA